MWKVARGLTSRWSATHRGRTLLLLRRMAWRTRSSLTGDGWACASTPRITTTRGLTHCSLERYGVTWNKVIDLEWSQDGPASAGLLYMGINPGRNLAVGASVQA